MDKRVTVRFYNVEKLDPNGPQLRPVLQAFYDLGKPHLRQSSLDSGVMARLERLESGDNYLAGEFTRLQSTNLPSEVHADGVQALPVNGPIGHGIAFRFRPSDSLLAIQYEPRVLSPSKVNSYIRAMRDDALYYFEPRINQDSWRQVAQHPLRKLTIGIASPTELGDVEDAGSSVADSFRNMGEAYEAPSAQTQTNDSPEQTPGV